MGEKSIGGKLIILAMVILIIAFIFCFTKVFLTNQDILKSIMCVNYQSARIWII